METNNQHPLLVLAIVISFSFAAAASAAAAPPHRRPAAVINANVRSVCAKAEDPAVCVATVSPFLLFGKTDPASVLVACVKRCMNENKLAMKKIPMCQGTYQSSNDYLKEALDGFKTKALADIQSKLGTARVDVTTCLDDLASSDGDASATRIAKSLETMALTCEDLSFKAKIF